MKKTICLLMALCVAMTFIACQPVQPEVPAQQPEPETPAQAVNPEPEQEPIYKEGTYSATALGNNGDITVLVTFTKTAIASVEVVEHIETAGISEPAIERIPKAIVSGQTLAVDVIAGATNTSKAIILAVEDCIVQAGGDVAALKQAGSGSGDGAQKPVEQLSADVLVVGSGLSGLSAAVAASEKGASVIVLEKLAVTGGSAKSSLGTFMTCEIEENKEFHHTESTDTLEAALERWEKNMAQSVRSSQYPDYGRLRTMLIRSMETISWIKSQGTTFVHRYGIENGMSALTVDVPEDTVGIGAGKLMRRLEENALKNGVVIYTDTPAVELITEGDVVVGAKATGLESDFEIRAGSVILACGGFGANDEAVWELIPEFARVGHYFQGVPGNTGDGISMATAVGAVTFEDNWVIPTAICPSATLLHHNPAFAKFLEFGGLTEPESSYDRLMVDAEGNRFMNEAGHYSMQNLIMTNYNKAPYYVLYDGVSPEIAKILDSGVETGDVIKADTIAGLAQGAKMDSAVLEATVARYAELAKAGKDEDFGKIPERMPQIAEEGPYYLVHFAASFSGTLSGVKTNDNYQVVREDGSVIEGLYAVGEMSNRLYYNQLYFSGSALTFSATMGRIAGVLAAS